MNSDVISLGMHTVLNVSASMDLAQTGYVFIAFLEVYRSS